jgi:hypothetical protein
MLPDETLLSGAKKTCPARATPHLVQRELVVHDTRSTDDRHFEVRLTTKDGNAITTAATGCKHASPQCGTCPDAGSRRSLSSIAPTTSC